MRCAIFYVLSMFGLERCCLLAALSACAPSPSSPSPNGAPPQGVARHDPIALNAACAACHPAIADEQRTSLHGQAHVDPIYQRALAIEPLPFCRSCHAPEADPRQPVPPDLGELGVACTSCHLQNGRVRAAPGAGPDPHAAIGAPAIVRSAEFASPHACATCHEFAFPDNLGRARPELMQSTLSEHAASPFAQTPCAGCHMPMVDGHRSHAFAASRSDAALKRALSVEATRKGPLLQLTLELNGVGHALPTGDLFRRLRIEAEHIGGDNNIVATQQRFLARHFENRPTVASLRRTVTSDDRPGGSDVGHQPLDVRFDFGPAAERIGWSVYFERVLHPAPDQQHEAVIAETVLVARGVAARQHSATMAAP